MKMFLFSGLALFLLTMIVHDSHILNAASVFLLLTLFIYVFKFKQDFFALSLYFFYAYLTTSIISCITEYGVYFTEIHELSYLTGATARNTLLVFFTLYFSVISFTWVNNSSLRFCKFSRSVSLLEDNGIVFIYLLILLSLFYIYFMYGHPNDYGYDRFNYWVKIAPGWGVGVKRLAEFWMIFLGRGYAVSKKKKYVFLFILGLIAFYSVGDKFTSFIYSIILFSIPIMLFSKRCLFSSLFSLKTMLFFLCGTIIAFLIIFSSYFYISGDPVQALNLIFVRAALQSQMWWGIDNLGQYGIKDLSDIYIHFFGFSTEPQNTGIYYLMKLIAPASLYYSMLEQGVTFTMAYPVNTIYFFSYPLALLVVAVFGVFLGGLLGVFSKGIKEGGGSLLILIALIYSVLAQVFFMGGNYFLGTIRFMVAVILIIIFVILSMKTTK